MPDLVDPLPRDRRPSLRQELDGAGLARAYGWRRVTRSAPAAGGAGRDAVWRVHAVGADGVALQAAVKILHPETRFNDDAGLERCLRDEHRAWRAGVAMPELLLANDGGGFATVERQMLGHPTGVPARVIARRWVPSTPVEYGETYALRRQAALDVSASLAVLHTLSAEPDPGLVSWTERAVEPERWDHLINVARAVDRDLAEAVLRRMPRLTVLGEAINSAPEPRRDRLVHNDTGPHNAIRPTTGRDRRAMIIDWDACCGGSAQREFVSTVARWCDSIDLRDVLIAEMAAAYRGAGGALGPVVASDLTAFLASMTHWLDNRLAIAVEDDVDGRTAPAEARASVMSMLGWVDTTPRLDDVIAVLAAA